MRLDEIYDNPTIINRKSFPAQDKMKAVNNLDNQPGGSFSFVALNHLDPHIINKVHPIPNNLLLDPYYLYLRITLDQHMAEHNPYVPRVYSIDIQEDQTQNEEGYHPATYEVHMEKLNDWKTLNALEMQAVARDIFSEKYVTDIESYDNWENAKWVCDDITNMIRRYCFNQDSQNLKQDNNNLFEVLDTLRSIKKLCDYFAWDIFNFNMMYRRTSVGVQLVFTDLLANHELRELGY